MVSHCWCAQQSKLSTWEHRFWRRTLTGSRTARTLPWWTMWAYGHSAHTATLESPRTQWPDYNFLGWLTTWIWKVPCREILILFSKCYIWLTWDQKLKQETIARTWRYPTISGLNNFLQFHPELRLHTDDANCKRICLRVREPDVGGTGW